MIRNKHPKIEINDRIADWSLKSDPNKLGLATYRVYADRSFPPENDEDDEGKSKGKIKPLFEHINTIGLSWGRNKQQEPKHYKSAQDLIHISDKVRTKHGRFLLNFGPDADGALDEMECLVVEEMAKIE